MTPALKSDHREAEREMKGSSYLALFPGNDYNRSLAAVTLVDCLSFRDSLELPKSDLVCEIFRQTSCIQIHGVNPRKLPGNRSGRDKARKFYYYDPAVSTPKPN